MPRKLANSVPKNKSFVLRKEVFQIDENLDLVDISDIESFTVGEISEQESLEQSEQESSKSDLEATRDEFGNKIWNTEAYQKSYLKHCLECENEDQVIKIQEQQGFCRDAIERYMHRLPAVNEKPEKNIKKKLSDTF